VQAIGRRRRLEIKPAPSGLRPSRRFRRFTLLSKPAIGQEARLRLICLRLRDLQEDSPGVRYRPPLLAMYLATDVDAELE